MARIKKSPSAATAAGAKVSAKISYPASSSAYSRTRLFKTLDTARSRPIVWISAPAGFGKSTLATSYLESRGLSRIWYQVDRSDSDPASFFYYMRTAAELSAPQHRKPLPLLTSEHLGSIHRFTENYFHDLFAHLPQPGVIVFDDFQELDETAATQDLLQRGLQLVPDGINVIVLSRAAPPSSMVRLFLSDRIASIGAEELKLTEEESLGMMRRRLKPARITADAARRLHKNTQGWIAGLVLMSEHTKEREVAVRCVEADGIANQLVFDYFANEIFSRAAPSEQAFLLKTAFLPTVSVSVAKRIAAESNSEAILDGLVRRNFFTTKRTGGNDDYQYHPLFREFLMHRAGHSYGEEQLRELKRSSAANLAKSNDYEAAIALLLNAEEWSEALAIVLEQAPACVAQGRTRTLEAWLASLPEPYRDENAWSLYWLGACRLLFSPAEARQLFIRAFTLFEKQTDATPLYRAWSGIIESFIAEYDDFVGMKEWLHLYSSLSDGRSPPAAEIENASMATYLLGLIFGNYDDPNRSVYADRVEKILVAEKKGDRRLGLCASIGMYYFLRGQLDNLEHLLQTLAALARASGSRTLYRLQWHSWRVRLSGIKGSVSETRAALSEALELVEQSGVHAVDRMLLGWGISNELCAGSIESAHAYLRRLATTAEYGQFHDFAYNYHAALVHLHEGDLYRAQHEALHALQRARHSSLVYPIGTSLLLLASVRAHQGALAESLKYVAEARTVSQRKHDTLALLAAYCDFCEANVHRLTGDHHESRRALSAGWLRAEEMGIAIPAFCLREESAILCATALEAGIAPQYVKRMIDKLGLKPPKCPPSPSWPRPIRIHTLGQFDVVKNGDRLTFSSGARKKASEKPRELLRALISLGARDVSSAQLAHMLWPDADGDLAKIAFKTTLYRLRKHLGEEHVVLQDGLLSLNPASCWLDMWALEHVCDDAQDKRSAAARVQNLLELYRGAFLPDDDAPTALLKRKNLASKFLRQVAQLGKALESQSDWHSALSVYQKAIEAAPLTEDFYIRLIHCYRRLERPAEALDVYHGCSTTLRTVLQMEPTAGLKSLYMEISREIGRELA